MSDIIKPVMYGDYIVSEEIYTKDDGINLLIFPPADGNFSPFPEVYVDRFGDEFIRVRSGLTESNLIFVQFKRK